MNSSINMLRRVSRPVAQLVSFDLVLALGICLLVWGMLAAAFLQQRTGAEEAQRANELAQITAQIAAMLTQSPGIPSAWERSTSTTSINALGMAAAPSVLSPEKVAALFAMNESAIEDTMGVKPHSIRLALKTTAGTTLFSVGATPKNKTTVVLLSPVIYNRTAHLLEVAVQE